MEINTRKMVSMEPETPSSCMNKLFNANKLIGVHALKSADALEVTPRSLNMQILNYDEVVEQRFQRMVIDAYNDAVSEFTGFKQNLRNDFHQVMFTLDRGHHFTAGLYVDSALTMSPAEENKHLYVIAERNIHNALFRRVEGVKKFDLD